MEQDLNDFVQQHMTKGGRLVPARLQTALALLERLRESPSLKLEAHQASRGSSGLESHEPFGARAHERFNLEAINKYHGRRSSNLEDWGQVLLDEVKARGFEALPSNARQKLLDAIQEVFAAKLRSILEQEPLQARVKSRTVESLIKEVLAQADEKGRMADVAQYLVGAKLELRFNQRLPVHPVNKGDRKSFGDQEARKGDFEIGDCVIEVALGLPDEKHLAQIESALDQADVEVWLLTRGDRVATWQNELDRRLGAGMRRVVVTSVEAFVGQNIAELAAFSASEKPSQIKLLIDIYNDRFVDMVGTPGIRIVIK